MLSGFLLSEFACLTRDVFVETVAAMCQASKGALYKN
jgi:hypothetical protein